MTFSDPRVAMTLKVHMQTRSRADCVDGRLARQQRSAAQHMSFYKKQHLLLVC